MSKARLLAPWVGEEDRSANYHVVSRIVGQDFLLDSKGKEQFVRYMRMYEEFCGVRVLTYCIMSNHFHITGYCEEDQLLSDYFRIVNSLFARKYNKRFARWGQVIMDRFKSPVIHSGKDLLKVMLYIDLHTKRAKMVKHPKDYNRNLSLFEHTD